MKSHGLWLRFMKLSSFTSIKKGRIEVEGPRPSWGPGRDGKRWQKATRGRWRRGTRTADPTATRDNGWRRRRRKKVESSNMSSKLPWIKDCQFHWSSPNSTPERLKKNTWITTNAKKSRNNAGGKGKEKWIMSRFTRELAPGFLNTYGNLEKHKSRPKVPAFKGTSYQRSECIR